MRQQVFESFDRMVSDTVENVAEPGISTGRQYGHVDRFRVPTIHSQWREARCPGVPR
jgi:hypothetical protein